jgi:integrase
VSVFIVRQLTRGGKVRYRVRWKRGRYDRIVYLGSFQTKREAEARVRWAKDEIAAGRAPVRPTLEPGSRTMRRAVDSWLATRIDVADETLRNDRVSGRAIAARFGDRDPSTLTPGDVQAWILELAKKYAPGTVRLRRIALGQVLDHAGVQPNPVRSPQVASPRRSRASRDLPTSAELAKLRAELPDPYPAIVEFLEYGGLRVGEAVALRWQDIDKRRDRFLVDGKTGQRWVRRIDGRPQWPRKPSGTSDSRIWPGMTTERVRGALRRASDRAGVRLVTPHALRHRHLSILMAEQVPLAELAARAGNSPATILATYLHVIPPD